VRKPKHHHSDRDKIYTPTQLVKYLIGKIPAEYGDSWCDPCYGKGVFYDAFPSREREYCEIEMGKDFLTNEKEYDWIVTNIPFSKPKEFIDRMSEKCRKGFGILCLANSMTATRLKQLQEKGLFLHSMTVLYIKQWGFGYRTDFYVFTREKDRRFEVVIE